ncbi:MAG: hypothetical protein IKO21_11285 [Fibrobacter sp.]|nr:hypothetical protein [Fibrobacter sp.]
MAKNKMKALGKIAETAKESARLRTLRIDGSQNGATLRTRIVRDKKKYTRTLKHKKSLADAGDFPFIGFFSKVYEFCKQLFAIMQNSLPKFISAGECR